MANRVKIPYKFVPREYQINLLSAVPEYYPRGVFVWHRKAGKDLTCENKMIIEAITTPGVYYYFFPTYKLGKKVLWDTVDPQTHLRFIEHIPPYLIDGKPNETELKVRLKNKSIMQIIGTDDFNSIIGTNPRGCVFSEYSLQDPRAFDYMRPVLRQNNGWAIFNFTFRGKNHAWQLYQLAHSLDDWYTEVLTVEETRREDGTPVVTKEMIEHDRDEGMSEELIQQEYYCSPEAFPTGAIYAKQLDKARKEGRIGSVPHVTGQEVYTFWDLGIDDSTTIWFAQFVGRERRFIDYYENSGEGLSHYVKVLREKPYVYGDLYLPHDAVARELSSGKSVYTMLSEDFNFKSIEVVKRARDTEAVLAGIEASRNVMNECWFDEKKCVRGLMALDGYGFEYDEENKKLHNHPLHNWCSHGSDAFRTFAVGFRPKIKSRPVSDDLEQYMTPMSW